MNGFVQIERWASPFKILRVVCMRKKNIKYDKCWSFCIKCMWYAMYIVIKVIKLGDQEICTMSINDS
jgi:hypothetical protein